MASSLPAGALGNLAASIKNIVSQPTEDAAGPTTTQNATPAATKDVAAADIKVSHADGKTIHKEKAAAVEHETVKTREHEKVDTVVDKEVHQDHYHRTVVPVKDKNVLPTKHTYKENEEEREFDHRDDTAATKAKQEGEQFKNEKEIEATKHTKQVAPTQQNETVHHHIHETIQPVIERETIKPVVVHTTNHVHETHHLKAEHHGATTAPAISLSEFEKTGAEGVSAAKSDIKAGAKADVKGAETTAVKVKEDVAAVKDKKTVGAVKTKVDNKEGTTANVNPTIT